MSDDDAYATFRAMRFGDGGPACPVAQCRCDAVYEFRSRRIFKCKRCEKQFSITSGTLFHGRKMSLRDILVAVVLFVNGAHGHSALRLSRDLNCSYKTAFVLAHKLRKVIGAMQAETVLTGTVEGDGIWVGGYHPKGNMKIDANGKKVTESDRRAYTNKRRAIVTLRERRPGGRSKAFIVQNEAHAWPQIIENVHPSADVITDQGNWGKLYLNFNDHLTVNHTLGHVINGIHINGVEAQNSRIRRGERGVYIHISGAHVQRYADEFCWRDDFRRVSNGMQYRMLARRAAITVRDHEFRGYWSKRPPEVLDLVRRRRLRSAVRRRRAERQATNAPP